MPKKMSTISDSSLRLAMTDTPVRDFSQDATMVVAPRCLHWFKCARPHVVIAVVGVSRPDFRYGVNAEFPGHEHYREFRINLSLIGSVKLSVRANFCGCESISVDNNSNSEI